jgi:RHS repeat-associated protein
MVRVDRSNGTATTYAFDALERVAEIVHLGPGDVVQASFTSTYDPAGNPIAIESLAGTTSYSYDAANRLTRVDYPDGSHTEYDYDDAGNRISTSDGTTTTASTINQLNQVTAVGSDSYGWDADGNLSTVTGGTSISWDAVGRMTEITAGGATTTYGYDGFGNLASRTTGGATTELLLDPANGLTEIDGSGQVVARSVFGYGLACRIDASGDVLFYGFDPVDSTRLLTDDTGAVVATYDLTPWGELRAQTGSVDTPFRFAGRFGAFSDDHGLIKMGARWYDPALGRFIAIEPERFAGGSNLYAYAANNPVRWADPTGFGTTDHVANGLSVGTSLIPSGATVKGLPAGSLGSAATGLFGSALGIHETIESLQTGETWGVAHGIGSVIYNQGSIALTSLAGSTKLGMLGGATVSTVMIPVAVTVFEIELVIGEAEKLAKETSTAAWNLEPVPRNNLGFLREIYGDNPIPDDVLDLYGLYEGPESVASDDPNEKLGPAGLGGQRVVSPNSQHAYTVYFENLASATAPAQEVLVTDQLDRNLDWSTVQLTEIAWGDTALPITSSPPFTDRVTVADHRPDQPKSWWVDVAADLSPAGQLSWQLTMLDPATGELPSDPLAGFLPPNDASGRGEGHVAFTVDQLPDLATGTEITNRASIVFDVNEAIVTNTWSNTVSWGACDPNLDGWLDAGDVMLLGRVLSDIAYVPPGNADCTEGGGETVDDLLWALGVLYE